MSPTDPSDLVNGPAPADEHATRYSAPADPDATGHRAATPPADPNATNYRAAVTDPHATGYAPTPTATDRGGKRRVLPCRFGDYELLEGIGHGGMGVVYRARQQIGGGERFLALKVIRAGRLASAEAAERFLREAQAAARLDHPGIVPIYDVGEVDGHHYFTMPLLAGGSVAERVRNGPLAPLDAARLVRQVAEAVQHAHERGVIHRDLKPANILLGGDAAGGGEGMAAVDTPAGPEAVPVSSGWVPKVTDFGLARVRESELSVTGEVLGTPSYMAPEQARGDVRATGPGSDVYGLGAILYCLLTGRPPFQAATAMETMRQVCDAEPVSPRDLNPGVSRDLETVCLKCLAKEPERRYASAAEVVAELGRYERGEPVRARPVGVGERALKWVRRRPAVAGLLAALMAVAMVGASLVTWNWRAAVAAAERERMAREAVARQAGELARTADAERTAKEDAKAKEERAEQNLYLNRIALAQREWEANHVGMALDLLDACPADRRGWEWRYLQRLCRGTPLTLLGHTFPVTAVVFSPDGTRIASASGDPYRLGMPGEVKVWDARTGQKVISLKGHTSGVLAVAFSPDGTRIASASYDQTVKLWDARTGQQALSLKGHTSFVNSVAFSPDSTRIASASGGHDAQGKPVPGEVKVWDARTGQEALSLKGHTSFVNSVAFSPDSTRIASASGYPDSLGMPGEVKVWDARTGQEVISLKGHTSGVLAVAFSPDGTRIASASDDQTVKLWDARTGQEWLTLKGHTSVVTAVAFSPEGTRFASASYDQIVKVWDTRTGQEALSLKGHTGSVTAVGFSPDGTRIASASWDQTVKVWDARTSQESLSLKGHTRAVTAVAFSPDGTRIASASDELTVWDAQTGQEALSLKGHPQGVWAVAFSPDGTRIASASPDQTVKVWDARTSRESLSLKGHTGAVTAVAFSPDGTRMATASADQTVKVWDAQTGQEALSLKGHTSVVTAVAFSPDGARLASASWDQTVKVWDARTGQQALSLKGHLHQVTAVGFSPDGTRIASASRDQTVKVSDARTGQEAISLKGHTSVVTAVAFSPDGARLASASEDRTVKVWDARTGQQALSLKGHTSVVTAVAFSPDGARLASASHDRTVKVWDARASQEALSLKGHTSYVTAVAFSPDGTRIASASWDQTVKVWDARTGQQALSLKGHLHGVTAVGFSHDGTQVSARDEKGVWKTWDAATGRELLPVPLPDADERVAVSGDGRLRALADVVVVRLVDTQLSLEQRQDLEVFWRDDPAWHQEQAQQAEDAQDWFAAAFHLGRLIALKPNDATVLAQRGRLHARAGRWPQAVADLAEVARRDPERANLIDLARAHLGANHADDYRTTVRRLADRVARRRIVTAVTLGFGRAPLDGPGLALTARLLAAPPPEPGNETAFMAELSVALPDVLEPAELLSAAQWAGPFWQGPALVRAKRFDEAARALAGWEKWPADFESTYRLLFVALAEHGRGNQVKARQAYRQATATLDAPSKEDPKQTNFVSLDWGVRIEIDGLRREVEQLLGESREPGKMDPVRNDAG